MTRIVDEVLHGIEIFIHRSERLPYEVTTHEIKWEKYEEVQCEKSENITDDIIDRVSSFSKKYCKCF
jgi:hypothetical protein